jgi:hypothetical protein
VKQGGEISGQMSVTLELVEVIAIFFMKNERKTEGLTRIILLIPVCSVNYI